MMSASNVPIPTGWPLAFVFGLADLTVQPGAPDMDLLIGKIQNPATEGQGTR
jgi:hypothetical protein